MKQEMYVRKTMHFLLFDWRKNNVISHPPTTGQGRKSPDNRSACILTQWMQGKRNMRRNEVYHEIKSKEEM